jgi:hypothetical protein
LNEAVRSRSPESADMETTIKEGQAARIVVIRRLFIAQVCILAGFCGLALAGMKYPVGSFFFVLLIGSLGGSIALLRRVRTESGSVVAEIAADMTSTLMPILYGALMAGVAYLLFMSGILSGDGGAGLFTSNLFPNFEPAQVETKMLIKRFIETKPENMTDVGKLLVWSFIAGYSESFVTGILHQLEKRTEGGEAN